MIAFLDRLLAVITPLIVGFLSFASGKKYVEGKQKDNVIEQSEIGKAVDEEIRDSHYDPIARNRLRDKWRR